MVKIPASWGECILQTLYEECKLTGVSKFTEDGITTVTAFCSMAQSRQALHELDKVGCGIAYGKVALMPVHVVKPLKKRTFDLRKPGSVFGKGAWDHGARLPVEEIYARVDDDCQLCFDFAAMIAVAGLIAGVGLSVNSSVMIVASMLVSPLMGPIVAFTFGTTVRDGRLIANGLCTAAVGVLECFLIGGIIGLIAAVWPAATQDWPTVEMAARGNAEGLIVGLLFALPSGVGVGLCVTGGGSNALVGVAIAASLLPPCVNCGINILYAACGAPNSSHTAASFFRIGGISFALFVLNVICIYITGVLFFWLKKVVKVRKVLSTYSELPVISINGAKPEHSVGKSEALASQDSSMSMDAVGDSSRKPSKFREAAKRVSSGTPGAVDAAAGAKQAEAC